MNWNNPIERLNLIERVGHEEYNRQIKEHHEKSIVARVGDYAIRPVETRFGKLFAIDGTDLAFSSVEQATGHARKLTEEKGATIVETAKTFNIRNNIGKSKYVVNFHDGKKQHEDGSAFYDIAIFRNKKKLSAFVTGLRNQGFIEEN